MGRSPAEDLSACADTRTWRPRRTAGSGEGAVGSEHLNHFAHLGNGLAQLALDAHLERHGAAGAGAAGALQPHLDDRSVDLDDLDIAATTPASDPRALTLENVERTLDELRPYLMADGGNVEVVEIDGPIVKVRLQGACGSCPSSTMTLKMGIERKLREAIPEVSEVVQVL